MQEQRDIVRTMTDYDYIHRMVRQSLKYYYNLDKALLINYESLNELVQEKRRSSSKKNSTDEPMKQQIDEKLMAQSIDVYSKIVFSKDLVQNQVQQQELIVQMLSQVRHNLRKIINVGNMSEIALDINAIVSNLIYLQDRVVSEKEQLNKDLQMKIEKGIEAVKIKKKKKINQLREEINELKEKHSEEMQILKQEIKELIKERNQLEEEVQSREDFIKSLSEIKVSDQISDLSKLTSQFDKYLDGVDIQRSQMVQNLKTMTKLCNFKQMEEDKFLRISTRGVQTEEIEDMNFIIKSKVENQFRNLKPFIKNFQEKHLLDTFVSVSIQKDISKNIQQYFGKGNEESTSRLLINNSQQSIDIDNKIQKIFLAKTQRDLKDLSEQNTNNLIKFPLYLTSYYLEEYKQEQLCINQLSSLLKQVEIKNDQYLSLSQQLLALFLGQKEEYKQFMIAKIQFLFITLYNQENQEVNEFDMNICMKLMMRFHKMYPELCLKDYKAEKLDMISYVLFIFMLRGHFKETKLWDFNKIEEDLEKSKRMIEIIVFGHINASNQKQIMAGTHLSQENLQVFQKNRKKSLIKSFSVSDTSLSNKKEFLLEAGKQLINDLYFLIVNFIIRHNEQSIFKKFKQGFDTIRQQNNDNLSMTTSGNHSPSKQLGSDSIMIEQLKELIYTALGDYLNDILILAFNEYLCSQIKEKHITFTQLQHIINRSISTQEIKLSRDTLIRVSCYKIYLMSKNEKKWIKKQVEKVFDDSYSFDQVKMHLYNFNSFQDIIRTQIDKDIKLKQIIKLFKNFGAKFFDSKNQMIQSFIQILCQEHLKLNSKKVILNQQKRLSKIQKSEDISELIKSSSPPKQNSSARQSIAGNSKNNSQFRQSQQSSKTLAFGFLRQGTVAHSKIPKNN